MKANIALRDARSCRVRVPRNRENADPGASSAVSTIAYPASRTRPPEGGLEATLNRPVTYCNYLAIEPTGGALPRVVGSLAPHTVHYRTDGRQNLRDFPLILQGNSP